MPTEYHRDLFERTINNQNPARSINELINNATEILTEQKNAFLSHELLRECLRQSQGKYDPVKIQTNIDLYQEFVPTRDGRLTTTEALNREQKIVRLALTSRDSQIPLSSHDTSRRNRSIAFSQHWTICCFKTDGYKPRHCCFDSG